VLPSAHFYPANVQPRTASSIALFFPNALAARLYTFLREDSHSAGSMPHANRCRGRRESVARSSWIEKVVC
jgi:hypothetical protein